MLRTACSVLVGLGCLAGCAPDEVNLKLPPPEPPLIEIEPFVARCAVSPAIVSPPYEVADLLGDLTEPIDNSPIVEYRWTLIDAPDGSAAALGQNVDLADPNRPFEADIVGQYTFELVAINDLGDESEPCEAILDAIPKEDLRVEMFWTEPGDDMDLHLIRNNGQPNGRNDCYYRNCDQSNDDVLNWGEGGNRKDNPTLDLDDIPGVGPENINLEKPAEDFYSVMVHDYPGSTYMDANEVTVNIYLQGELVFEETRTITGENSETYFADIDWVTQEVIPR